MNGQQPTVVIAEDDTHISYILQFMLSREGFHVLSAENGRQASRIIDDIDPPCLVLLDIMLPHRDGFQLIQQIRSKPGWADVPIIMLTARSQELDITRALEAGANDYVTKPFRPKELMVRIRRLVTV
jgi:DNA-binding response OmpR family regulator